MPTRAELESFGILVVGGGILAGIILSAPRHPPRQFFLDGLDCDPQQILLWLDRKIREGKITSQDVQLLLQTDIAFGDWLRLMDGLTGQDINELNVDRVCTLSI